MESTFWTTVAPTAIGALIGGLITLGAIVIKEFFGRRRSIQSWYEQYYIIEGIDRLMSYLSVLEDIFFYYQLEKSVPSELFEPYPREAAERFRILLPGDSVSLISILSGECQRLKDTVGLDTEEVTYSLEMIKLLQREFMALHKVLLGIQLRSKTEIYDVRYDRRIAPVYQRLENAVKVSPLICGPLRESSI